MVPGPGTLTMTFKPADGGEPMEMTVKEFAGKEGGKGGCGLGMFNTTEVTTFRDQNLKIEFL